MTTSPAEYVRQPLPTSELHDIPDTAPTPDVLGDLLAFDRRFQDRVLRYFAALKLSWERQHAGRTFPGLCAEVDSVTGAMRPLAEQRVWSWGDCRALGIWAYFLQKGVVPAGRSEIELFDGSRCEVDLVAFYQDYCDLLHRSIRERYDACGGKLPFLADIASNRASDDPRNIRVRPEEYEASHVFLITALFQYAMLRGDDGALALGRQVFDETVRAGLDFRFVNHLTKRREPYEGHGSIMVTVGAVVDVLKSVELAEARGDRRWSGLIGELTSRMLPGIDYILDKHYDPRTGALWERNRDGQAYRDEHGRIIADPGHAAELCGFLAEFTRFLPDGAGGRWRRDAMLRAAQDILRWVDRVGYSPLGLLYKNVDVVSGGGCADTVRNGVGFLTAPWWNVRELASASARLLAATGDQAFWAIHRRAFHAGYRHYPNARIGGCFLQTLDAESGEPLPFHPATGNLDPMHDGRAREREIEALSELSAASAPRKNP